MIEDLDSSSISVYKESILEYIGGFIVRKLVNKITCEVCCLALIGTKIFLSTSNTIIKSLTTVKDRGGLIYPSRDVSKILKVSEMVFKGYVSGDNFKTPLGGGHF